MIGHVVIPTRDRASSALRSLDSVLRHASYHGRSVIAIVCDQSESPQNSIAFCSEAELVCKNYSSELRYIGRDEAERVSVKLAREFPDCDVKAMLAPRDRYAYGANRNLGLLASFGRKALFVDDDVLFEPRVLCSPHFGPNDSGITDKDSPQWDLRLFGNEDQLLSATKPIGDCILRRHEDVLGRKPASSRTVDIDSVDTNSGLSLWRESQPQGIIRIASCGIYGDSGIGSTASLLASSSRHRNYLLGKQGSLLSGGADQFSVRQCRDLSIGRGSGYMSTCFSIDNRSPFFPFFPIGRGEDFALSSMIGGTQSLFADLPFCVAHRRTQPSRTVLDFSYMSIGQYVGSVLRGSTEKARSIEEAPLNDIDLRSALREISYMDLGTFTSMCTEAYRIDCAGRYRRIEMALDNTPHFEVEIRALLDRQLVAIKHCSDRANSLASRLTKDRDAISLLRSYLRLVSVWPDVCDSARSLGFSDA